MASLRAGAAVVDITPPVGGQMDGYGGRAQGSQGVHDPLMSRVVVLDDGATRVAIISCDLLGIHPEITERIMSGLGGTEVVLAATHNHAGPAGLRSGMFGRLDGKLAEALIDRILGAVTEAASGMTPAVLKPGATTVDTVSMNRRHPAWAIDPEMRVLLVDGEDGPIASVLNFACHATVLSGANLMLSGEFPGAAARLVYEKTGAPCVYLNGACGDVNPTWIRQDFDSVERVGQIVGGAALKLIGELRTLGVGQRAHNIRWDEFPQKPVPGRIVEPGLKVARREVELPLRKFEADEVYAKRIEHLRGQVEPLPPASKERREVMAQISRTETERWSATWSRRQPEAASQLTQMQALLLGDGLALLALPGEFFVETAAAIRSALAPKDLFIACYANDYVGYIVPEHSYDEGGYEAGVTPFAPEAEGIIRDASIGLLGEVMHDS
jgi:hypothetical protein